MTLSSKKTLAKTLATASLATLGVTACTQNPFGSTQTANTPQSTQDVQTQLLKLLAVKACVVKPNVVQAPTKLLKLPVVKACAVKPNVVQATNIHR